MPLEGEQASYASGSNATNAAVDRHTDNLDGHADRPNGLTATPSTSNEGETLVAVPQTCSVDASTYEGAQWHVNETDSPGIYTNMSSNRTDTLSIAYNTKMTQGLENGSPDPTTPWE